VYEALNATHASDPTAPRRRSAGGGKLA